MLFRSAILAFMAGVADHDMLRVIRLRGGDIFAYPMLVALADKQASSLENHARIINVLHGIPPGAVKKRYADYHGRVLRNEENPPRGLLSGLRRVCCLLGGASQSSSPRNPPPPPGVAAAAALVPEASGRRWSCQEITFSVEDLPKTPTATGVLPLLCTPTINNVLVPLTLIDGGAGLNILSLDAFDDMQLPRARL